MSSVSGIAAARTGRSHSTSTVPGRHVLLGRAAALAAILLLVAQAVPVLAANPPAAPAASPAITLSVDNGTTGGTYTGFTGSTQNLTTSGKSDWRLWGRSSTSLTGNARKAGGAGISALTQVVGSPTVSGAGLRALGNCCGLTWGVGASTVPFAFDWSDGASGATTGSKALGGLQFYASSKPLPGYGFSFTVPATASPQRLKVWVHAHHGTGRLTAAIGSLTRVDTGVTGGENAGGIYTLDFAGDGTPGQVMTVTYVLATVGSNTNASNAAVYAAALSPADDFTIAASPASLNVPVGTAATSTVNIAPVGTSAGTVALTATASNPGLTASLSAASYVLGSSPSPVLTVQAAASVAPGSYTVTVGGTLGSATHTASVAVTVPQPDFTIAASPDNLSLAQGAQGTSTVSIAPVGASTGNVTLTTSTSDPGLSATVSPGSFVLGGSATAPVVTVNAGADLAPGTYTATITGTLGSVVHATSVAVTLLAPGAIGVPELTNVYHEPGSSVTLYAGRIAGLPNTTYTITFSSAASCPDGVFPTAGYTDFGSVSITTDANGNAFFNPSTPAATAPNAINGTPGAGQPIIAARVTGPAGRTSGFSPCVVDSPDNNTWPRALDISAAPQPAVGTTIDQQGVARWFKVHVVPGGSVRVDLSNLTKDYDVYLFRDIAKAYEGLTSEQDITKLSAEFAGSGFSGSGFSGSGFSGSGFSGSGFSGSGFSGSGFSGSGFSGSGFSADSYSGSGFSGSGFSGSGFSGSGFSGSGFSPDSFSSAQIYSLVAWSNNLGTSDELTGANTWTNSGDYYIRVSGKDGAHDLEHPFALNVTVDGSLCTSVADALAADASSADRLLTTKPASIPNDDETIILTDTSRFGGADTSAMTASLDRLAKASNGVVATNGVVDLAGDGVVDLAGDTRVHALQALADGNAGCVYAKNLVASAAKDLVDAYRSGSTAPGGIKDIVLAGGDDVVPFFRYPDTSSIGPEVNFFPPVLGTSTSEASLRSNYVLGQDAYGASRTLSLGALDFPIPELPVGRLVETPGEISGMVEAYLAQPVVTPHTSLVTGYDFIADAANAIKGELDAGTGQAGQALIDPYGAAPADGWDATALKSALLDPPDPNSPRGNDISFLGGHFSANSALAADFTTVMTTNDFVAGAADMTNSIIFSIGCHSGYNIVDPQGIPNVTNVLDWPQAFAQKRVTSILGTGYQYGDTDFIEYSERINAEFAKQLRYGTGAVAIGDALMASKIEYLKQTPNLGDLHEKALLEATLYGIPMLGIDMPAGRHAAPSGSGTVDLSSFTTEPIEPAHTTGLRYADLTQQTPSVAHHKTLTNVDASGTLDATWYSAPGGAALTTPGAPILPLYSTAATAAGSDGYVLRGIGFQGGDYQDSGVVPLTGAPGIELQTSHTSFSSPTFYPTQMWSANYFDALTGGVGTTLFTTPAQHRAENPGAPNVVLRLYSDLHLRLFYSNSTDPGAKSTAPVVYGITSDLDGSGDTVVTARVVGDPKADVQQVWVTYTEPDSGTWRSFDLKRDTTDPTLWAGKKSLAQGTLFMVQAVNGYGLVSQNDNSGADYLAGTATSTAAVSGMTLTGSTSGIFGSSASITATLTSAGSPVAGKLVVVTLGTATRSGTTDDQGKVTVTIPLLAAAGDYPLSARFIGDETTLPTSGLSTFTILKAASEVTITCPTSVAWTGAAQSPCTATATGEDLDQPLIVSYAANTAVGTASASATFYGDTAHTGDSAVVTFGIVRADQKITFDKVADDKSLGDPNFTLSATASSGLPVTFAASGACAIADAPAPPNTVVIRAAGACLLTASQAGDGNYGPAPDAVQTLTIAKQDQTIDFAALGDRTYLDPDVILAATTSSGLQVTFTAAGSCSIVAGHPNEVALTGAGSCTITASQAGDDNFSAATDVVRTFAIAKAGATLSLSGLNQVYTGSPRSVSVTTSPANLGVVSFTYDGSPTAPTSIGSYAVVAHLDNPNYTGDATGTLVISPATGSMTLAAVARTPNPVPQFSDTVDLVATLPAGATGSVSFTFNGIAVGSGSDPVGTDGTAKAAVRLDQTKATSGAGPYGATATYTPAAGSPYTGASANATVQVSREAEGTGGLADGASRIDYTGLQIVPVGTAPVLSATLYQGLAPETGDTEPVDFSKVTVNVVFTLYPAGCTSTTCPTAAYTSAATRVTNTVTAGVGTVTVTCPKTLAEGAYLVTIKVVANASQIGYILPLNGTSTLTVSTTKGTYMTGGGTVATDSTSNTQNKAGAFAFNVSSGNNGPVGSAIYAYRMWLDVAHSTAANLVTCPTLNGTCRDVDVIIRSAPLGNFVPGQSTAYPMTAYDTGKATVQFVDAADGTRYSALEFSGGNYRLDATDYGTSGATDTVGFTLYRADGSVFHQAFIPATNPIAQTGLGVATNQVVFLAGGNVVVKPK